MKADRFLAVGAALVAACMLQGCGGPQVVMLHVDEPALELGKAPPSVDGADCTTMVVDDELLMVTVGQERVVLDRFSLADGSSETEDLVGLQPELFALTDELIADALLDPAIADLGPDDREECLRTGTVEMGRFMQLYEQGLVSVDGNLGLILSARTPLRCEDQGISTVVAVEHLIVLDETYNRVQHDHVVWIGRAPLEALAMDLDGRLQALWLAPDGLHVTSGQGASQAMGFVSPWDPAHMPVHFLEAAVGDDLSYAFGVIERPMASVGQGESYLVLYLAPRNDLTYQEVVRVALPDHPQIVDAVWTGDRIVVAMFAETLKPHAESFADVRMVAFDAQGVQQGDLVSVHHFKDPMGGSFGLLGLGVTHTSGGVSAVWLHRRESASMLQLVHFAGDATGPAASHELGWDPVDRFQVLSGPDGPLVLWTDKNLHLLKIPAP